MTERTEYDSQEEFTVPMERDQELVVAERAAELARSLGFGPDPVDEIRLAVIEAVINAIEHGAGADHMVHVSFGLKHNPRCLEISIADRGGGFDVNRVETPDIHHKIGQGGRKRGWGLYLMKNLMDEVRVESNAQGSLLVLIKKG